MSTKRQRNRSNDKRRRSRHRASRNSQHGKPTAAEYRSTSLRLSRTAIWVSVLTFALGVVATISTQWIQDWFFSPPPVESVSLASVYTGANRVLDESGTEEFFVVQVLVVNNTGGPDRTVLEIRGFPGGATIEPSYESYERRLFWTSQNCDGPFRVTQHGPTVVVFPASDSVLVESEALVEVEASLSGTFFLRFNNGEIHQVVATDEQEDFGGFEDEVVGILNECAAR